MHCHAILLVQCMQGVMTWMKSTQCNMTFMWFTSGHDRYVIHIMALDNAVTELQYDMACTCCSFSISSNSRAV